MNQQKLARLQKNVRIGGKGSARRKRKVVHRSSNTEEKRLQVQLNRLGVKPIEGCEEVNLFTNEGDVIRFKNPKFSANFQARTAAVGGQSETVALKDCLPAVLNQLGPKQTDLLKNLAASMPVPSAAAGEDDDDVPELVENFDAAE